jgi:HSP20 family molecular chaperone IbpA
MLNLVPQSNSIDKLFAPFEQILNEVMQGTPLGWRQYANEPLSYGTESAPRCFALAAESFVDKKGGSYHCRISIPGVDPKDVNVQVEGTTITISGERKIDAQMAEATVLQSEGWYGSFQRTITVPKPVNLNEVKAEYRNGILEITAPISATALPRRIEVQAVPEVKQIES